MTNYRRADETQRRDKELKAAIREELVKNYQRMDRAKKLLENAYEVLSEAATVEEDEMSLSSGIREAKFQTFLAIRRFDAKLAESPTETYVGNVAAFMSKEQAQSLKEKYAEDSTD